VIESHNRNYILSQRDDFVDLAVASIVCNMERPSYKAAKQVIVRIHESGDFYSQEYLKKWCEIAAVVGALYGDKIQFIAYTKSVSYMVGVEIPENLFIRYSLWDDTPIEQYAIARSLELPVYTAVDNFDDFDGVKCRCADCATCGCCWNVNARMIACEIH